MNLPESQIVLLGAGPHARMLAAFLTHMGHTIRGCIAPAPEPESGLDWLGPDEKLSTLLGPGDLVINGIGSVAAINARRRAFEAAVAAGARFMDFRHPSAISHADAEFGVAAQVFAGAIVQPGCRIGSNVLLNTGAIIEHNVQIGDHCHVAPGACLGGGVIVGEAVHVGAGAVVLQGLNLGSRSVIGAGAVVLEDVPPDCTVVGNPARRTEKRPH